MNTLKTVAARCLVVWSSRGIALPTVIAAIAMRITVLVTFVWVPLYGQPPITFTQFGSNANDIGFSVSATAGAVYVGGYTSGALPGQTSVGQDDAFVRKYDSNGVHLWTRQFGTSGIENVFVVSAVDESVYVGGATNGALPGQVNAGDFDAFIRKYDGRGNELWTRQFGTSALDTILGVVGLNGSVYVVGSTNGALPGQTSSGRADAFVRKYTASGIELWTRQFGSSEFDDAHWIDGTAWDGVYVVGNTVGTLYGQTSAGGLDAYVRKYDFNGNELWTRQFGTVADDFGFSIAATTFNGVYLAGSTNGAFPGQISAGFQDAFLRKYDRNGNELWTRQFGSGDHDTGNSISVTIGGVYVTGTTTGALPGQSSAGGVDGYVVKYAPDGRQSWIAQFGTDETDQALTVSAVLGGVYITGNTGGQLPGQISLGAIDAFLAFMSAR